MAEAELSELNEAIQEEDKCNGGLLARYNGVALLTEIVVLILKGL